MALENESFLSEQQTNREQIQKAQSIARRQINNLVTAIENTDTDTDTDTDKNKNTDGCPDPELYTRLSKRRSELQSLESQIEELDAIMGDHLMFLNNPDLIVRNALDFRTYLESDDEQNRTRLCPVLRKKSGDTWQNRRHHLLQRPASERQPRPSRDTRDPVLTATRRQNMSFGWAYGQ